MSVIEVNKLTPLANNGTITLGDSGDTFSIPSGVTLSNAGTATGFGKIGQVLQQEYATAAAMSATSYADNGQTLAITPSATSSKILVMVETQIQIYGNGNNSNFGGRWKIVRTPAGGSAADAFVNPDTMLRLNNTHDGQAYLMDRLNITHLDSPSTTSAVTYKVMQQATTTNILITSQIGSGKSKLTLMEVLA